MECLMDDCSNSEALRGSEVDVLASPQFVSSHTGVAAGSIHWGEDQVGAMIVFLNFPAEKTVNFLLEIETRKQTHLNFIQGTSREILPRA